MHHGLNLLSDTACDQGFKKRMWVSLGHGLWTIDHDHNKSTIIILTTLGYMCQMAPKENSTSSIEQLEARQLLSISNVQKSSKNVEVENVANDSIT